jgi:hypothetical protein
MMIVIAILAISNYFTAPVLVLWGWIRWAQQRKEARSLSSTLAFLGFVFANLSFLLAFGTIVAAGWNGGFRAYDPKLIGIFRWGLLFSFAGILLGIGGAWRRSSLRWHAPALATGLFFFWFFAAMSQ